MLLAPCFDLYLPYIGYIETAQLSAQLKGNTMTHLTHKFQANLITTAFTQRLAYATFADHAIGRGFKQPWITTVVPTTREGKPAWTVTFRWPDSNENNCGGRDTSLEAKVTFLHGFDGGVGLVSIDSDADPTGRFTTGEHLDHYEDDLITMIDLVGWILCQLFELHQRNLDEDCGA